MRPLLLRMRELWPLKLHEMRERDHLLRQRKFIFIFRAMYPDLPLRLFLKFHQQLLLGLRLRQREMRAMQHKRDQL